MPLAGSCPPQGFHVPHLLLSHCMWACPRHTIQGGLWTLVLQRPGEKPHLQQPGLQLVVQQDVKTKDLKTGTCTSTQVLGKTRSVVVTQNRVSRDDGFDDDALDVSPQLSGVIAMFSKPGVEC